MTYKFLEPFNFRHIKYLQATAKLGSFRKAGIHLGVNASSVSRGIRDLEMGLGISLFNRSASGASLNDSGRLFLNQATDALLKLQEGLKALDSAKQVQRVSLRLCVCPPLTLNYIYSQLKLAANRLRSSTQIDVQSLCFSEAIQSLSNYELDVIFSAGPACIRGFEVTDISNEQVYVALPERHSLAGRISLLWSDLVDENFIVSEKSSGHLFGDLLKAQFTALGCAPRFHYQSIDQESLMTLVSLGVGLTLLDEPSIAKGVPALIYRPIAGETITYRAFWRLGGKLSGIQRLLYEVLYHQRLDRSPD